MSDAELKKLVDDIKKRFAYGEHVMVVCHSGREAIARTIAEVCGLHVDKVFLQKTFAIVPLNTVIISKNIELAPTFDDCDKLPEIMKCDKDDSRLYIMKGVCDV